MDVNTMKGCRKQIKQINAALLTSCLLIIVLLTLMGCSGDHQDRHPPSLIKLGEQLFRDTRLSVDSQVSCASCHDTSHYFIDQRAVSVGVRGVKGTRNAPGLLDIPLMTNFFWDGRETKLENVVLQPFTNPSEMALKDNDALMLRISTISDYQPLFASTFGNADITSTKVAQALSAYLRSQPLKPTRYDQYIRGQGKLSNEESAGLKLFQGKAGCAQCHQLTGTPVTLTDNNFHHTGIGFEQVAGDVAGALKELELLKMQHRPLGEVILAEKKIAELGRFSATRRPSDLGAFRTPSLRNVTLTSPYMHDGSIPTLREAVEREIYYRSLARGRPIALTVQEQQQLLAFLETFTTESLGDSSL